MLRRWFRRRPGPVVQLFSSATCPLCDALHEALEPYERRGDLRLEVVDIHTDPDLSREYGHSIPVLAYRGRALGKGRFEAEDAVRRLKKRVAEERARGRGPIES